MKMKGGEKMDSSKTYEDYKKLTKSEEEMKEIEKIGYYTAWEIQEKYGINKQKTLRNIKNGSLNAFMKEVEDKYGKGIAIKYYIINDDKLKKFIEDNKK